MMPFVPHSPCRAVRLSPLAAALLLTSCSPPRIDLEPARANGRVVVTMSQDWGLIFSDRQAPCIGQAELFDVAGSPEPVWKIEAAGGVQCVDLGSLTIGVAPAGFDEVVPLPAQAKGVHALVVSGIGWGQAGLTL